MIFYYIRHGDPIYDPDSLTPLGHRQAEAAARRLAMHGIDRVFASTSNRAILTAQPTAELTRREITQLDFCNEAHAWREFTILNERGARDWVFTDPRFKRVLARRDMADYGFRWYEHPELAPYADSFREGAERIDRETDALLLSLGYEHLRKEGGYRAVAPTDEHIALFAHGGFGAYFLSSLLDIPYPLFAPRFVLSHSSITAIQFGGRGEPVIPYAMSFGSEGHLYREGLPLRFCNNQFF